MCLDSLGHKIGETAGVYQCHGTGGNQEWELDKQTGTLKSVISKLCMVFQDSEILLKECSHVILFEKKENNIYREIRRV